MTDKPVVVSIGGVVVKPVEQVLTRCTGLIWGKSKCGKSTLAATAPGPILDLNFDPDGAASLSSVKGLQVADFSKAPASVVETFKTEDCGGLERILREGGFKTVIFDSITSFTDTSLQHGVEHAKRSAQHRTATIEDPGYGGYGRKNTWTNLAVSNILRITGRLDINCFFIAHEDNPLKDKEGNIIEISVMLGSALKNEVPLKISEIWMLTDTGNERRIAIRPVRGFKPMGSRMFLYDKPEFVWKYDAITGKGEGLSDWIKRWEANGRQKIPTP